MLMAIRAKKRKMLKSLEHMDDVPHADKEENTAEPMDTTPIESIPETTNSTQDESTLAASTLPTEPDPMKVFSELILPNISRLVPDELDRLTHMNTKLNSGYTRPLDIEIVTLPGPKPPSPNAKVIKRMAMEKQLDSNDDVYVGDTLRWQADDALVSFDSAESSPHRLRIQDPVKSCIRVCLVLQVIDLKVHASRPMGELSKSPVRVTRILYTQAEPAVKRRLTKPAVKAIKQAAKLAKSKK
jgi:hypothetical protein